MTDIIDYIRFFDSINLSLKHLIIQEQDSSDLHFKFGWRPVIQFEGIDLEFNSCIIDIRQAWDSAFLRQDLFDWLLDNNRRFSLREQFGHLRRIIVYLCEKPLPSEIMGKMLTVPSRYLKGTPYQLVQHIYIQLPCDHPFHAPSGETRRSDHCSADSTTLERNFVESGSLSSAGILTTPSERRQVGGLRYRRLKKRQSPNLPILSIITVVFNGGRFIEQAIQSVLCQAYPSLEYIVIDGGSTDDTIPILQKYNDQIDCWNSEPDDGIYHAMNKGWKICQGDYVYFLGSDDVLLNVPTNALKQACQQNIEIIYSDVYRENGTVWKSRPGRLLRYYPTTPHQGQFIKRSITDSPFDLQFAYRADYDLDLRMHKENRKYMHVPVTIAIFRAGGIGSRVGKAELLRVMKKNYGILNMISFWIVLKLRRCLALIRDSRKIMMFKKSKLS